ncbi:twin-arginine translocase TatA/TatE family subunit [Streptomyces violaceus]|uniref:twin-arginine translocase TatA/TatE family subunit n=1 Tax=Streptomyces violaceus TaxID=1936 RepID=UPI0031F0D187
MFGLSELAIILIVVIAVIGAKKLPELARSAGKSARILKAEARAAKDEEAGSGTAPRCSRARSSLRAPARPRPARGRRAPRTTPDPSCDLSLIRPVISP